jgi:hypothetical protein
MFATWDFEREFAQHAPIMFIIVGLVPLLFAYLSWWLWQESSEPAG